MIRIPGKIPISIYPTFWIFAALIGFLNSQTLTGTLIWIFIIFVSVLFHEFGHALTAYFFGRKPRIELVAMGGLTYHDGEKLPFGKQFIIVLNGPIFGFILFGIAYGIEHAITLQGTTKAIVELFKVVNLFWTVLNLLPVMPLDGGQLLRIACEGFFGVKGFRYALIGSITVAMVIALASFLYQFFLIGALFFLLAFQGYDAMKRTKKMSEHDRKDNLKEDLEKAEKLIAQGKKEEAVTILENIRKEAKEGMIFTLSTQYLAYLKYDLGKTQEAYDLLLPLKGELSPDALCLLHQVAFELKNFPLVAELAGSCYQAYPSAELAIRNACSCAALSQPEAAVGWLETAAQDGLQDIQTIVKESFFDPIRSDPLFKGFIHSNRNLQ